METLKINKMIKAIIGSLFGLAILLLSPAMAMASEANLVIPQLSPAQNILLEAGIVVCL